MFFVSADFIFLITSFTSYAPRDVYLIHKHFHIYHCLVLHNVWEGYFYVCGCLCVHLTFYVRLLGDLKWLSGQGLEVLEKHTICTTAVGL